MKKARRRAEQRMRHCSGPLIRSRTVTSPASQMSATRRTTCCRRRIRTKTTERHLGSGRCIVGTREHNANSVGPRMPELLNVPAANEATGLNLPLHVGQLHWRNRGRRIRARVRTQPLPQSTDCMPCHAMRALQLTTRHATDRAQHSMRCAAGPPPSKKQLKAAKEAAKHQAAPKSPKPPAATEADVADAGPEADSAAKDRARTWVGLRYE